MSSTEEARGRTSIQQWATSSDAELVDRFRRRDESALAEIYAQHAGRILALARLICGASRAEDVVQEIFIGLWLRPDGFDPDRGRLGRFLALRTRSRAIDALRSDTSRSARERSADDLAGRPASSGGDEFEGDVVAKLIGEATHVALQQLRPEQREVIALAYFGGLSYREVALAVGRPEGTVKGQIRSGLLRLRAELQVVLGEPGGDGR